jgi:hypothetical protein
MKTKLALTLALVLGLTLPSLRAGGPWLVYSTKEAGTERSLLLINLGEPQYSFTEAEGDNDTWIHYNPKSKTVFRKIWSDNINDWHRLSWARSANTFFVAYSQYGPVDGNGVSDHGVFFGTGSLVSWPNKGKNIGISGRYAATLKFSILRIDAGWTGDRLGTGTRAPWMANWVGTLEVPLTKALNDVRAGLATNQAAKDWVIDYFVGLGYTQNADVVE